MSNRIVATMGTGAIADDSQVAFTLSRDDVSKGVPAVWAIGLAGAEEVQLWAEINDDWVPVAESGSQVALTATQAHTTLVSAGVYGVTKDATVGSVTLIVSGVK